MCETGSWSAALLEPRMSWACRCRIGVGGVISMSMMSPTSMRLKLFLSTATYFPFHPSSFLAISFSFCCSSSKIFSILRQSSLSGVDIPSYFFTSFGSSAVLLLWSICCSWIPLTLGSPDAQRSKLEFSVKMSDLSEDSRVFGISSGMGSKSSCLWVLSYWLSVNRGWESIVNLFSIV